MMHNQIKVKNLELQTLIYTNLRSYFLHSFFITGAVKARVGPKREVLIVVFYMFSITNVIKQRIQKEQFTSPTWPKKKKPKHSD